MYIDWKEEQEDGWIKCKICGHRCRGLIPEAMHFSECAGKEQYESVMALKDQNLSNSDLMNKLRDIFK
jgi:hypothetical protein